MPALALAGLAVVLSLCSVLAVLAQAPAAPSGELSSVRSAPPGPAASREPSPPGAATPLPAVQTPEPTPTLTPTPSPTPTVSPSPSPVAVAFLNAPLSARRNRSNPVTLRARTTPRLTCTIAIGYTDAPQLDPDTADSSGNVSWSWRVGGSAPVGTWPITVTCGAAKATTQITVS
jgi:hypothetical protein